MIKGNAGVTMKINLKDYAGDITEEVVLRTVAKASLTAKQYVRVDKGNLRQSITHEVSGTTGEIYTEADYGHAQEYGIAGTSYGFTPYLRPAAHFAGSQAEVDKATVAAVKRRAKL